MTVKQLKNLHIRGFGTQEQHYKNEVSIYIIDQC